MEHSKLGFIWEDVEVHCYLDPWRVKPEIMRIAFLPKEDGSLFPMPCNGCDDLQGGELCERCCAEVTNLLFRNPEKYLREVIYPNIPENLKP